jgi:hypothetical protein
MWKQCSAIFRSLWILWPRDYKTDCVDGNEWGRVPETDEVDVTCFRDYEDVQLIWTTLLSCGPFSRMFQLQHIFECLTSDTDSILWLGRTVANLGLPEELFILSQLQKLQTNRSITTLKVCFYIFAKTGNIRCGNINGHFYFDTDALALNDLVNLSAALIGSCLYIGFRMCNGFYLAMRQVMDLSLLTVLVFPKISIHRKTV